MNLHIPVLPPCTHAIHPAKSEPPKQLKMVQAWIEIHKDELLVDWELAVNGDEPFRIAPLQ
ncbi:MAG: DUF4160 domain-containing protein [Burkholderiales bacterium]